MPTITNRLEALMKQTNRMKTRMVKGLLTTLKKIDRERRERVADLDEAARMIAKELADLGWNNGPTTKRQGRKPTAAKRTGKRIRRSANQLKTEAVKVVGLIRSAGKEGISGAKIRKQIPGVGQNIKAFVKQYTGQNLKTTGKKAAMRYFHS